MRRVIFVLFILLGGCATASVVMPQVAEQKVVSTTMSSTTTTTLPLPTTTTVVRTTSTTVPETTTTTLVDRAAPAELRIPTVGITAPVIPVGPRFGVNKWYPDWGTTELYGTDQMVDPGELGGAFILGHSNVHKDFGPDVFFNLVDDEEYSDDIGVSVDDKVIVDFEDGTSCVFRVIDLHQLRSAPGEPLVLSPGRFFPKFENWGQGGPEDERVRLSELATGVQRLYLMGSYAGPEGNAFIGGHREFTAYIAADLEVCSLEEGSG